MVGERVANHHPPSRCPASARRRMRTFQLLADCNHRQSAESYSKRIQSVRDQRQKMVTQPQSRWTEREDRRLRELAKAGLSLKEISGQIGRSWDSVRCRAAKLSIAVAKTPAN